MYLIIDNFDSFTYNLKAYFEELGKEVLVLRSDAVSIDEIEKMHPQGIIISPGPKRPADAEVSLLVVEHFKGKLPILGVCLGHQVIGYAAGATVEKGTRPMHGKVTEIEHNGTGVFLGLPKKFNVTRYHSLVVKRETLPEDYQIDAWTEEGTVMAFSHRTLPLFGVQFHPEAVLSEYGHEILENFCRICEAYGDVVQQNEKRIIVQLEEKISAAEIFSLFEKEEDAVFLDSSLVNELGRYSIIGLAPYLKLVKKEDGYTVNGNAGEGSFEEFVKQYLREHFDANDTELPMVSGAIGYFSYDYGRKRMGISTRHPEEVVIPDAVLTFYDKLIIEDQKEKKLWLVANGQTQDARKALEEIKEQITSWKKEQDSVQKTEAAALCSNCFATPNFEKQDYMNTVDEMIRYIYEGDIYIANMTQHLKVEQGRKPYEVFQLLRTQNPSPFGGYFNYGDFQIVCASPERFLRMKKGHVETRPIKGTRKRGATPEEDAALRKELEESGKDQSELLMIVDLERNDLNRVCVPGSVKVTELFSVEAYATVFHLVSNVEGDLREDLTVMDLIEATFPGGSITGAPKYRAMEIIDELEHGRRNLYTGSIGYLTMDNHCDFNIVIRTALYKDGAYYLGVGGGITAESELEFEYEETLQKAKAVLEAIGAKSTI